MLFSRDVFNSFFFLISIKTVSFDSHCLTQFDLDGQTLSHEERKDLEEYAEYIRMINQDSLIFANVTCGENLCCVIDS